MNTIYILGGSMRVGKSTIMKSFIQNKPMPLIETDALQKGLVNMLIGKPQTITRQIKIEGVIETRDFNESETTSLSVHIDGHTNTLIRKMIDGIIYHYKKDPSDFAVEGTLINPDYVAGLRNKGLNVKAVFVGFNNDKHIDSIFKHAETNEIDWVNEWVSQTGNKESVRQSLKKQLIDNDELKIKAVGSGFTYIDISNYSSFEEYEDDVIKHLLS